MTKPHPGGLYDTKHVALALAARHGLPFSDTGLGQLYGMLTDAEAQRSLAPGAPPADVRHAPGFDAYAGVQVRRPRLASPTEWTD